LSLLISHRVRFVVVGGHAVAVHGHPRLTEDLDVFVEASGLDLVERPLDGGVAELISCGRLCALVPA
jgi:hypothetical protein